MMKNGKKKPAVKIFHTQLINRFPHRPMIACMCVICRRARNLRFVAVCQCA